MSLRRVAVVASFTALVATLGCSTTTHTGASSALGALSVQVSGAYSGTITTAPGRADDYWRCYLTNPDHKAYGSANAWAIGWGYLKGQRWRVVINATDYHGTGTYASVASVLIGPVTAAGGYIGEFRPTAGSPWSLGLVSHTVAKFSGTFASPDGERLEIAGSLTCPPGQAF